MMKQQRDRRVASSWEWLRFKNGSASADGTLDDDVDRLDLQNNPDVLAAEVKPLLDFLREGREQGRFSAPHEFWYPLAWLNGPGGVDTDWYLRTYASIAARTPPRITPTAAGARAKILARIFLPVGISDPIQTLPQRARIR
jgi:hypothetical protein